MERGDIFSVALDPKLGHEQSGHRPVLIISKAEFNRSGVALVCPITMGGNYARFAGFAVALTGAGTDTQGAVLCHQLGTLDLRARNARKIESAPDFIIDDVLAKIQAILG
jgi:mRNA interferase ChpB